MKIKNHPDGFTLVEVLAAVAIGMIMTGFGLASWSKFRERSLLDSAASQLKTELRLAHSRAINGQKPTTGCGVLDGYQVDKGLDVRVCCDGSCSGSATKIELNQVVNLTFSSEFPIVFHTLSGRIDQPATIQLSYHGQTKTISILSSGATE